MSHVRRGSSIRRAWFRKRAVTVSNRVGPYSAPSRQLLRLDLNKIDVEACDFMQAAAELAEWAEQYICFLIDSIQRANDSIRSAKSLLEDTDSSSLIGYEADTSSEGNDSDNLELK